MEIKLEIKKSVEENASRYFDLSKKAKKKLEGAKKALAISKEKLEKLKKQETKILEKSNEVIIEKKKSWYHKFRWFVTSEGLLVVGGRDSTTNEIIIKKHAEKEDIVFHTDMAGSPFVVLKNGITATEKSLQEVADFTAAHSKGWKKGLATLRVFYVTPEQVTKEAQAGEHLQKGSFMIRGKTTYVDPTMNYAIGVHENFAIGGPVSAIKHICEKYVEIIQGDEKPSATAKKIRSKIDYNDIDDIIRVMPVGCKVKVERKRK
jgi:predicted ribosome quality control (RQC) complex YloA/Tae2 family protein